MNSLDFLSQSNQFYIAIKYNQYKYKFYFSSLNKNYLLKIFVVKTTFIYVLYGILLT